MSGITDIINRIAALAEQRDYMSNLRGGMICSGYDPKRATKELSPEEIERIVPIEFIPPRLSLDQIEQITEDFPFYLPLEVYELYQRGNGCLPIGLGEKDWESFDSYFTFPSIDEPFYPLRKAIERYRDLDKYREKYDIDPRFFPISEFEHYMRVVIGAKEQQESSPVLILYTDCFDHQMEWPSLTNMMLAWVEVEERGLSRYEKADREEIKGIWEKYGGRW
jgi:hypothetical protein